MWWQLLMMSLVDAAGGQNQIKDQVDTPDLEPLKMIEEGMIEDEKTQDEMTEDETIEDETIEDMTIEEEKIERWITDEETIVTILVTLKWIVVHHQKAQ